MPQRNPLIETILKYNHVLTQVDFMREIFMIPDRVMGIPSGDEFQLTLAGNMYQGKLFVHDHEFYTVRTWSRTGADTYMVAANPTDIPYNDAENTPLATPGDMFEMLPGDIGNYHGSGSIKTSLGRYIANYLFFVYPFGTALPYLAEEFSAPKLEAIISRALMDGIVQVKDVKEKYINALTLFGQSNEIMCPNITEKTITVPPEIHILREKLVVDNREALERGDATTMSMIENTLIKAYRDYLGDDESTDFLLKSKYYKVTLKKLLLTQGMTERFGQPGKFDFIAQPMGSGWKQENLAEIFNEVRAGSYARAVETQNGGVIAKLILRVLQDSRIELEDCGTKHGEHLLADKLMLIDLLWNYVINADGSLTMITEKNIPDFVGKQIEVRTPGYCKAEEGYCKKCFGHAFEVIKQEAFAPVANDFAGQITTSALKRMHGVSTSVVEVTNINRYLITR